MNPDIKDLNFEPIERVEVNNLDLIQNTVPTNTNISSKYPQQQQKHITLIETFMLGQ